MISADTFARYAALRVPRYTSYPTAPNFTAVNSDLEYRGWLAELDPADPISVYLHIPFCREMCWYCGCHTTVARRGGPVTRYVGQLAREIRSVASQLGTRLKIAHLHWGGGSPTLLTPGAIRRLDRRLRHSFDIAPEAEIGVEIDPRTLSEDVARAFVSTGANRFSIGVQTFDPLVQAAINRVQPFERVADAVAVFRQLGVTSINFDLIYGLPRQTTKSCVDSVRQALRLKPDRLAVFGYAHVPSFKPHQRNISEADLPSPAERLDQAQAIAEALVAAGYEQIGLDHFALPDDRLARAARAGTLHRNFQGYTTDCCATLIGLGASAISRLPSGFVQNATRIPDYQRHLSAGRLPTARACAISSEDSRRARIIERLMCDYRAEIGPVVPLGLAQLERDGLIRLNGPSLEVTKEGRPLVRAVAAAFDSYLPQMTSGHVTAV